MQYPHAQRENMGTLGGPKYSPRPQKYWSMHLSSLHGLRSPMSLPSSAKEKKTNSLISYLIYMFYHECLCHIAEYPQHFFHGCPNLIFA